MKFAMRFPGAFLSAFLGLSVSAGAGEGPRVVASIGPVHSLVDAVMDGIGKPTLLVPPGASPHAYALKPSEARALSRADVVFRVGPEMEAFLDRPLKSLAVDARVIDLMHADGIVLLHSREGGEWGEEGHEHEEHDAHLWLDPHNGAAWVRAIARQLGAAAPANATAYAANAGALDKRLAVLTTELEAALTPVRTRPYVVFHDAYQYFEHRFRTNAMGAVTISPERPPGARRLTELRERVRRLGVVCVFTEPQFRPKLAQTVVEGTGARIGVLDPLGGDIPPGPGMYFQLLRNMASALRDCLGG